jgi:uncharacterized protein (DUF2252 family)
VDKTRTSDVGRTPADHESAKDVVFFPAGYLSADQRRAEGKALREAAPRAAHAGWKPAKDRRDPVELLQASNEGRIPQLIPIRFGRMAHSPFAFYRGAAAIMAADLATTPTSGIRVQACGDAHMMNFGGFATPERNIFFDINDFDETLPAPWEWDVKRLAASIVIAARHLGFRDSDAANAASDTVRSYRQHMADYASMRALDVWYDRIDLDRLLSALTSAQEVERVKQRVEEARRKSTPEILFPKLVEHSGAWLKIKDEPPLIFHPTEEEAPEHKTGYARALEGYRNSLPDHVRTLFDGFHLFDLAIKVVGVGSVGSYCAVGLFMAADDDPIFLQIKEARASFLEPHAGRSRYSNHGERVVAGQRLMQSASDIFLGWTRGINDRDYYFRQLRDAKISGMIDDWDAATLREHGKLCGWALARAHARSGDRAGIAGYLGPNATFDDAVCEFAVEYADQNLHDYRAFVKAIREGRIRVPSEQ